jgi:hypothetical protein
MNAEGPSASGSDHVLIDGLLRNFSFNAREQHDGAVEGGFTLQARFASSTTKVKGQVTCLSLLSDNRAYMAGFTTEATDDIRVGVPFAFMVVDNGEGNATPDEITRLTRYLTAPSQDQAWLDYLCANPGDYAAVLLPVERGNIQVRP